VEALAEVAAELAQRVGLLGVLDALRDDRQPERLADRDDGVGEPVRLAAGASVCRSFLETLEGSEGTAIARAAALGLRFSRA